MLSVCPIVGTQEMKRLKLLSVIVKPISLETGHAKTFGAVVWPGVVTLGVSEER